MIDDKTCDCDCASFFNILSGALALLALAVHPLLTIGVLILWAMLTAARQPKALKPRDNAEIYAAIDAAHQRAVARERLPLHARIEQLRRDERASEPATGGGHGR